MSKLDDLNVIHVAGTKGKGTTCTYLDAIFRAHRDTGHPVKVGLYTSPHLKYVRDRIQIDSQPISEELFAQYFFEVWDRLEMDRRRESRAALLPGYFHFLTLMCFYTFIKEKVTWTILETGVGGEYDATNVVEKPVATGITTLDIDHVQTLGSTLPEIAWHKSGIFKRGCPAFTVHQPEQAMQVIRQRATEKGSPLIVKLHDLHSSCLTGTAQINASLAFSLASTVISSENISTYLSAVEQTEVPGRRQLLDEGDNKWYLDGAHNKVSLKAAAKWFANATNR